jgi:hypothetical protein
MAGSNQRELRKSPGPPVGGKRKKILDSGLRAGYCSWFVFTPRTGNGVLRNVAGNADRSFQVKFQWIDGDFDDFLTTFDDF